MFEHYEALSPEERKIFNFNPRSIDWRLLCGLNVYGI
jgi:hypothetical protein